jgi:hypothetical protein
LVTKDAREHGKCRDRQRDPQEQRKHNERHAISYARMNAQGERYSQEERHNNPRGRNREGALADAAEAVGAHLQTNGEHVENDAQLCDDVQRRRCRWGQ